MSIADGWELGKLWLRKYLWCRNVMLGQHIVRDSLVLSSGRTYRGDFLTPYPPSLGEEAAIRQMLRDTYVNES